MDHLREERTYELVLRGVKVCRNCTHWMNEDTCPHAPVTKWYQRKVDTWSSLTTCDTFSPNEQTDLAMMHLTQRRMMGENIRINEDVEPKQN